MRLRPAKRSGSGDATPARSQFIRYCLRVAVAEKLAWRRARALVFRERLYPVHDDRAIALRALHPAPFTARQVMRHFADPVRFDVEALEVVHDDVSRRTL